LSNPPSTYSQRSAAPVTSTAYLGDGQWHHFGPQPAPASRDASPQTAPQPQEGESVRIYKASVAGAR
jgi:hypothetical protein